MRNVPQDQKRRNNVGGRPRAPPWFPHSAVRKLHRVVTDADLDRNALLCGLEPSFRAGLPACPNPSAQILIDLDALNWIALEDGTIPLRTWLENASALLGPRAEAKVLRRAIRSLT